MPEPKAVYIDPQVILESIEAKPVVSFDPSLEPSGPHHVDEGLEQADIQVEVGTPQVPEVSLNPGVPPVTAPHYTNVLDDIWAEFDDPEERTAARLSSLLDEVADEAQRVHLLSQDLFEKLPGYKLPESERERFQREFLDYLRRLHDYRKALAQLEPDSLATDDVYLGLVKRRQGAGPVPDVIMHVYFAQQLGILTDHADEMGEGFVGRVMEGLEQVANAAGWAGDLIGDATEEAADDAEDRIAGIWERISRPWLIGAGVLGGTVLTLAGALVAVRTGGRKS